MFLGDPFIGPRLWCDCDWLVLSCGDGNEAALHRSRRHGAVPCPKSRGFVIYGCQIAVKAVVSQMGPIPPNLSEGFTLDEAAYLRQLFDNCFIGLIARSQLDKSVVLVRWLPRGGDERLGVTDPRHVPPQAYYVLFKHDEFELTPIRSDDELGRLFPGHFKLGTIAERPARGCLPWSRRLF